MHWLKEHGVSADYHGYRRLPLGVLMDARLIAEGEAIKEKSDAQKRARRG